MSARRSGFAVLLLAAWAAGTAAQEWRPQKNVDFIVSAGAGGAADRQARFIQRVLQTIPGVPSVTVSNRAGGAGTIAWTYLSQNPGDAHNLATLSIGLLTNEILGTSKLSYRDLTPINILLREYVTITARADSPLVTARDIVARLKQNPASVTFCFSAALGNQNHVVIGMLARAAGVDPKTLKIIVFNSGSQGATAVLGGHIDLLVGTPGTALPHVQTGKMRIIGISAPERQPGDLAAIPTLREQGVDALYYSWRGVVGARGLTPAQIAFWDQAFAKVVQEDEWKKDLDKNGWAYDFRASADARKHLDFEFDLLRRMLADLGVTGKPPAAAPN